MLTHESFQTTCSYCGVGCGVLVHKTGPTDITVKGDLEHPTNRGELCSKGMNLHYSAMDRSDRLLFPMSRPERSAPLERVSWNDAMERAVSEFKKYIREFGPDSVGFYVSGQLLTEEYYIINKLIKGFLGTNNIDTNSRLCMSSAVSGYKMAFGEDSVPVAYEDIELADCFLIAGANPAWCHPVVFRRIEKRKREDPNVKIIVVDPRKTESCESADIHLQIHPGTDIHLFHAIARILIEKNWIDKEFIIYHTKGFDELKEKVFEKSLEEVSEICGVPSSLIYKAAEIIGLSNGFLSLWAMGLNQSVVGVNKNLALINLSLITGKIGKPGSGPFSLTGQPNAMGGREVGGLCNLLPAHRDLSNPDHRKEVAEFWGVQSVPAEPGHSAVEMFESLKSGKMKAIWIVCTNPTVSLPDSRMVEAGLRNAEFVVVQDISKDSGAIPFADVVLPAAGWGEKQGTMTSSDRRISYLSKFMEPPGEAKADTWIIQDFANRMGFGSSFSYKGEEEIFLEHCRLTTGTKLDISGLDYQELKNNRAIQWPYPSKGYLGSPRLFEDKVFYRPDGKAKLHDVDFLDDSEKPSLEYPLVLTTGRFRDQWHSMTRTGKVRKLKEHRREPNLEIHPSDAIKYGIKEGMVVEIVNSRGSVRTKATITNLIKPGVVFLPMHWGKKNGSDQSRSNNLTSSAFDPNSKQPGFKISAVKVFPYKKQKEKLLLIGGGNASLAFLKYYRSMAPKDEITVICKEEDPFYNRVLLPDYIGGGKEFEELLPNDKEEILSWDLDIIAGTAVTKIYPEGKKVRDSNGILHSYNKLILALGSSAITLSDISPGLIGIFSLRNKYDADRIRNFFVPNTWALIVGGGLLGLEVASVLVAAGIRVTMVIRTDRLMSKKLDPIGSEILREEIQARGIELIFDAEISKLEGTERISAVKLTNGKILNPDGIIYAIGTKPNFELAEEGGLDCGEGVIVDSYLRSSDPDIYSIGEMSEHEGEHYGTVAAVEDQAKIAAQHIFGYTFDEYVGSLHTHLLKVPGLDLVSLRLPNTPFEIKKEEENDYEEITFLDRKKRIYKKCIMQNDRLVAAILIGDTSEFVRFREWIISGIELGEKRRKLFSGGELTKPLIGKVVCSCNGVGDGNILEAIYGGEHTVTGIGKQTGAGTGCGSCRSEISNLLKSVIQKV